MFKESGLSPADFGRLTYLADECFFDNSTKSTSQQLGAILFDEWSPFWNTSATFLIQKTPLLDVKFHEAVKQHPTLHVIIVRHPMTSNPWKSTWSGLTWLDAFTHTFELIARNEIEWYAVVTYEALIHYHEKVVDELMRVIRSGMKRYGSKLVKDEGSRKRRLHLHATNATTGPLLYLVPKDLSISVWETCLKDPVCKSLLEDLTTDVLSQLGFVNMDWDAVGDGVEEEDLDEEDDVSGDSDDAVDEEDDTDDAIKTSKAANDDLRDLTEANEDEEPSPLQLSPKPGLVTVSSKFSHVLYSSEIDALPNGEVGRNPTSELVTRMKDILATYKKKYPKKVVKSKNTTPKETQAISTTNTKESKTKNSDERYWKLVADSKSKIDCEIDTKNKHTSLPKNTFSKQYVVNIHGLVS